MSIVIETFGRCSSNMVQLSITLWVRNDCDFKIHIFYDRLPSCTIIPGSCYIAKYIMISYSIPPCKPFKEKEKSRKGIRIVTKGRKKWIDESKATTTLLSKVEKINDIIKIICQNSDTIEPLSLQKKTNILRIHTMLTSEMLSILSIWTSIPTGTGDSSERKMGKIRRNH